MHQQRIISINGGRPDVGQAHNSKLSPVVIAWVREEADNNRTLSVIDDVARSRDLVGNNRAVCLRN